MMNNKSNKPKNFLDCIPVRSEDVTWSADVDGIVTLEIENKGVFNRIAQKLLKKPRITYIHLDEVGSFVWQKINGSDNVMQIGKYVEEHFADDVKPLYERLAKYISIMESYNFVDITYNKH